MKGDKQLAKKQPSEKTKPNAAQTAELSDQPCQKKSQQQGLDNYLEFTEMNKELEKINTTESATYFDPYLQVNQYFDPYLQVNQSSPTPIEDSVKVTTNQNQTEDYNRGNYQNQRCYRREHRGGRHKGHHHHRNHRGYQNWDHREPIKQQEYPDQYWHQLQDRRQSNYPPYHHPPPHHPPPFNPWHFQGVNYPRYQSNQMPLPHPPPPPYFGQNFVHSNQNNNYFLNAYLSQPSFTPNPPPFSPHSHPHFYPKGVHPPCQPNYENQAKYQQREDYRVITEQKTQNIRTDQIQCQSASSQSYHHHQKKRKWMEKGSKQQKCWRKKKGRKHSRSRSKSSSSSSEQSQEQELNQMGKQYIQNISAIYSSHLQDLFESRSINTLQRQKIINLLIDKFPKYDAPVQMILNCLAYLQSQNLLYQMPYIKVIKIIIKFNFNMEYAIPKIMRIQAKKIKKYQSDLKYSSLYGDMEIQPLLQHGTLIDMDQTNVIYLIDGNNILPTQRHFRKYFQSGDKLQKVEAQLRCQWLVSFALQPQNCFLFFDQKFASEDMKKVSSYLFPSEHQINRTNKIQVIYGDQVKADEKIIQKLIHLVTDNTKKEIILVSADRELYMRCMQITKLKHTGGRFFFKFIKYIGVHRDKQWKDAKKMIKKIISYVH